MFDNQIIVVDCGSETIKAGFSGEKAPHSVFRTIIGYVKYLTQDIKIHEKEKFFGDEAFHLSPVLIIVHPLEQGQVKNWTEYENIMSYTFDSELKVDPSEHSILITEATMNPKINREKTIQLMFEKFNVLSFFTCKQSVLSLYSYGKTTGVVLDTGYNVTNTVPIYEGYSICQGINQVCLGGNDLTLFLNKKLRENGYQFNSEKEKDVIREFKKKNCYVALDYEEELNKNYENYDKKVRDEMKILLGERFRCPELLFRPSLNGFDFDGIDKALFDSIMKCDSNVHSKICSNVVLSGGNSMLNGLDRRIEKEILKLMKSDTNVNVKTQPDRKYAAWIGGSILSESDSFQKMAVTKDEYNESGSSIVHQKCIL